MCMFCLYFGAKQHRLAFWRTENKHVSDTFSMTFEEQNKDIHMTLSGWLCCMLVCVLIHMYAINASTMQWKHGVCAKRVMIVWSVWTCMCGWAIWWLWYRQEQDVVKRQARFSVNTAHIATTLGWTQKYKQYVSLDIIPLSCCYIETVSNKSNFMFQVYSLFLKLCGRLCRLRFSSLVS